MQTAARFLSARWENLLMINYVCDPERLKPYLAAGTELDFWQGEALVSLVGFRFLDTRLLGIPVPFHRNFDEVNLRFYTRYRGPEGWRRGVTFVRELVPKRAIATVARICYNEPYLAVPMWNEIHADASGALQVGKRLEYAWRYRGEDFHIAAKIAGEAQAFAAGSEADFITEHYWGYTPQRDGSTIEYQVEHPSWRIHAANEADISENLKGFYGEAFREALSAPARSVLVAEGSAVTVRQGVRLRG